ncbi:MAG: N-acetylmuramoyl-L-alanine amidase [Nitrospirota bacterium]|nr:MAG: N-acetylmuramoyl-L-alanine amidase [Nitrospirota bacterium]
MPSLPFNLIGIPTRLGLTRVGSSGKKIETVLLSMPVYRKFFLLSCLTLLLLTSPHALFGGEKGSRFPFRWESSPHLSLVAKRSSSTAIRNIRAHQHKKYTRLVLDLDRNLHLTPSDRRTETEFQLQLPNTRLLKKALSKTTTKTFPMNVTFSRNAKGILILSVPTKPWKRYKWYVLQKPSRIVLDFYPTSSPKNTIVKAPKPAKNSLAKPPVAKTTPPPPVIVAPPVASVRKKDMVIVLDPGHGGKDPGALGRKGTREKDIVLKISGHLRDLLAKETKAKVFMTRESDVFIELKDRAAFANQHKADLFVSIHINSHPKKSIKGLELYHFGEASDPRALEVAARENGTPLKDNGPAWQFILADKLHDKKIEDSQELAWTTKKALVNYLQPFYKIKDHGVKTAPFFVLRMTTMPAILAEIAFISNPSEEKLLKSTTYQKRMARGIFEGIKVYITPLQTASR